MNRIRFALAATVLLGVVYAAAGLFDSLYSVGLGMAVASAALIGYGLVDWMEER